MTDLRPLILCLVAIVMGGCTVGGDYVRPEVDSPADWRVDYQSAADTANTRWWTLFNDPQLDALVDIALRENKDVRIAAARIEEFAARVDIFRSGLYPQIGYDGEGSRNKASRESFGGVRNGDRTYNNYSIAANLSWELDLWGRIRLATEAARADLLAQEENRRAVILSLVSAVASSYISLRQLDEQLLVAERTLQVRGESLDLFELKFKAGVVSDLEVAQVRTEYEQAAAAIPPLERQIALTENALSILIGFNPQSIPRGLSINDLALPPVPAGIPAELLERRPDIRLAEQNLIAAEARIDVARTQYFPTISLTGLFGFASDALSELLENSANVWSIGGSALGPVFTGGRISSQVSASEAVQRQALVSYLQTVQTAFREVDDSLVNVQKSREQLVAEGRRVDALKNYARLARLRYDGGYTSYIEVLDAQRFLFEAELQYVAVQGDVFSSLVGTYKAMGGGWVVEAQEIADETDYPDVGKQEEDKQFVFPVPTEPAGAQALEGYRK